MNFESRSFHRLALAAKLWLVFGLLSERVLFIFGAMLRCPFVVRQSLQRYKSGIE